jgi:hypothetical protein
VNNGTNEMNATKERTVTVLEDETDNSKDKEGKYRTVEKDSLQSFMKIMTNCFLKQTKASLVMFKYKVKKQVQSNDFIFGNNKLDPFQICQT